MSFKKKQLLGFCLILLFLAILLTGIIFMLNSVKGNMTEIVEDRYYKVSLATEISELFNRGDREILFAANETLGEDDIEASLMIIDQSHTSIDLKIAELTPIINQNKAKQLLKQVETNYASYVLTEAEIIQAIELNKGSAELSMSMDEQRVKRTKVMNSIEDFKQYQEDLMTKALSDANATYNSMIQFIMIAVGLSILVISLTILWMIRSTSKNLKAITAVINKMDFKDLSNIPRITVQTDDEIGEIAKSFNEMALSLENYNIKETEFTTKISDQNWIQTRLADIATMYQRIVDVEMLGERFIMRLAPIMEASMGAFYIRRGKGENARFVKLSSFAGDGGNAGREEFAVGEGLIGQCALEKRSQIINQVPDDYKYVMTALGEASPKSIFMAPVVFEDEVVAMIELASFQPFTKLQQNLFSRVLETLGVTINSIEGRMEIERLLKESQTQSEELQSQSEELQAQSEELQTQAEELRMINEQLEERNRETEAKSRELQRTKWNLEDQAEQLKQSSKYKSEFLANMSHELRTPLNSILILSEMLSDHESALSEEHQEFANVIHSSGQDLLSLINDILDLSKVEVGKMEVVFDEMNISEIPQLLLRNFEHVAQKKGLEFTVQKDKNVPDIFFTDQQRLQQILKNLLSNAFKFTDKGSISVRLKTANEERVSQCLHTNGAMNWLEINVTDTGIGITKEKQNLIFEAFQQADGATMRKYGGTGLGLSICREFSKLLGGWVLVDSEEGKGSTFTLLIPSLPDGLIASEDPSVDSIKATAVALETEEGTIKEDSSADAEIEQPLLDEDSIPNIFKNKKVLVVDDDHRNIYALKNALEQEGMEIVTAKNGMECLEILQQGDTVDAVLMDVMMPGMDGYETMRRIRANGNYDDLAIIALTAKAMKGDRKKCLQAGASDYVSKPLKLDQLLSVLRVWLTN